MNVLPEHEIELMEKILNCYCDLSPENLSCDGELSRTATMQRFRKINKELKIYFKLLGRKVTEDEIWQWDIKRNQKKNIMTLKEITGC